MSLRSKPKAIARAARKESAQVQASLEEPVARKPRRALARIFVLLRWLLLSLLSLACVAVFYVAIIMGETPGLQQSASGMSAAGGSSSADQSAVGERPDVTPMPTAAPFPDGQHSVDSTKLSQLAALFPARLAILPAQQGFALESGKAEDLRVDGAKMTCRVVTLTYTYPNMASKVVVRSAVPSGYIHRYLQTSFVLDPSAVTLASLPAMVLTAQGLRSIVAVDGDAVYIVEGSNTLPELTSIPTWITLAGKKEPKAPPQP